MDNSLRTTTNLVSPFEDELSSSPVDPSHKSLQSKRTPPSSIMKSSTSSNSAARQSRANDEDVLTVPVAVSVNPSAIKLPLSHRALERTRSEYYGHIFACREPTNTPRERVVRESLVVGELKTNIIVNGRRIPFIPQS